VDGGRALAAAFLALSAAPASLGRAGGGCHRLTIITVRCDSRKGAEQGVPRKTEMVPRRGSRVGNPVNLR
jgi:hypothetical protein